MKYLNKSEIKLLGLPEDLHQLAEESEKNHQYNFDSTVCSCGRTLIKSIDETNDIAVFCIEAARFDWDHDIDPYERLTMSEEKLLSLYTRDGKTKIIRIN